MTDNIRFQSGAASELYVAHVLVENDYEIFTPVMTQSKIDLIAMKEHQLFKIQVKKATWSKAGPYAYLQSRLHGKSKRDNKKRYTADDVDYFAVTDNQRVWLIPYEDIGHQTSVCLDCTNPDYKPYTKYDANIWRIR